MIDGFGGWVPDVGAASGADEVAGAADEPIRWGPRPGGGRHRTAEPEPAEEGPDPPENLGFAPDIEPSAAVGQPAAAIEEPAPADDPRTEVVDDPNDQELPEQEPIRGRAHRIGGRWGRFAELWVPEPMRNARLDPGRRGMIVLILVAAVAAVATAIGVWRDRPEPRPIETSVMAAVSQVSVSPSGTSGPAPSGSVSVAQPTDESSEIVVSVTGLVANPGIVTVPADARVADAITAAGGAVPGANLTGMNLAARLADGDSVVVTDTPGAATVAAEAGPAGGEPTRPAGLVDLNTADKAALDTLPGVGPVMAQNIIAWRESNGRFTSIEQLQEISGIGPSRYAQISALVTVG